MTLEEAPWTARSGEERSRSRHTRRQVDRAFGPANALTIYGRLHLDRGPTWSRAATA